MSDEAILAALASAGHAEHAEAVRALIRPAIRVTATALAGRPTPQGHIEPDPTRAAAMKAAMARVPLGASRYGGLPDMPPGASWPEREGVPMEFVAQVRLADLAGLPASAQLPPSGSLLFFYNSQWETSDMADAPVCAVLYHPGPDAALVRADAPRVSFKSEYVDEPLIAPRVHGLASLAFSHRPSVPGGVSPFVRAPLTSFWQDFTANHHAALTGRDPAGGAGAVESHLLGYVEAQDYVDAHANGTDDQLLFQIVSDAAAEFQWGDMDDLFFILRADELSRGDFSNARLYNILG